MLMTGFKCYGTEAAGKPARYANPQETGKIIVAYVTSWSDVMPNPRYMTHINYAFGHVNKTCDGIHIANEPRLRQILALKQQKPGLKIMLSIGGWGSGGFSEMAADTQKRETFAKDCRRIIKTYGLDGIDIDWEYPTSNAAGISSSPADTENFTLLMRDIRKAIGQKRLLTLATVASARYINFKEILPYINFVNIMSYDMGSPGKHHAALYPSDNSGWITASQAVDAHLAAGVPASMLTMGLPFYGRGTKEYADFRDYKLINTTTEYTEQWDNRAKVPYLVNSQGEFTFGFENPRSLAIKCRYILQKGLLGGMYWEYAADNEQGDLQRTVYECLAGQQAVQEKARPHTMSQEEYPGNYAHGPRFKALIYYTEHAEEAHVQFAKQTIEFFKKLNYGQGFNLDITTDFSHYSYEKLQEYSVIIMPNGYPMQPHERAAFEKYMENGGGWMGFHAAAYNDKNTNWPWFVTFLGNGVFYCNNWPPQPVLLETDKQHPVTKNLPESFVAPASEWYMWTPSPRCGKNIEVLLSISPKNYPLGIKDVVKHGDFPVVWTNRKYRMIYLNMGHGDEEYQDATQKLLFINAFRWIVSTDRKGNPFE